MLETGASEAKGRILMPKLPVTLICPPAPSAAARAPNAATRATTGAAAGAVVAGPIGAVAGAAIGGSGAVRIR